MEREPFHEASHPTRGPQHLRPVGTQSLSSPAG
jgi:hypothetical protein